MRHSLKTPLPETTLVVLTLAIFIAGNPTVLAQTDALDRPSAYLLLDGSYLIDDCPICGRPTIEEPMRGTFNLRLLEQNPLFSRYALENISFKAGSMRQYTLKGSGTFQFGGELAVVQEMFLQVEIEDGITNKLCIFTNSAAVVDRPWPMIGISLDQTNGTLAQTFTLRLAAAPVREIWFSTVNEFTSAYGQPPANYISPGDLISSSGRVVKRNQELTARLGIMPSVPDIGLDAVDILPRGEIAFSAEQDEFSEMFGPLRHGDVLSSRGRILHRQQDLLAPFIPQPSVPDAGLDAVQELDNGDLLFSIETNVFSERLAVTLQRGDLLSSAGQLLLSNQQLLARFHPANVAKDYGLDAFYVWPHGEIWFSPEEGFQDQMLGPILPGDLLSNSGYVVFHNLELLNAFAPIEDLADFGLDALFVVTDATPSSPAPRLVSVQPSASTGSVQLAWEGQGRVFQVESADVVSGPFLPISPILPELSFADLWTLTNRSQAYYRLRQW